MYNHLIDDCLGYCMDALKSFKEANDLVGNLLGLRKKGTDLEDALIEQFVDGMLGHLGQINREIEIMGERLDMIDGKSLGGKK